eukprot:gene45974-61459_t
MAVAIPVTIDYLLDICTDTNFGGNGSLQRGVLIFSLWIPDLIIYSVVIPKKN